jgi:glutathione synthase/RimK-type ligase-like ATP-grasp enzyme
MAKKKMALFPGEGEKRYKIDSITSMDDILLEDKWKQYELFSSFMPKTELLQQITDADKPNHITKKRISSRSTGIFFQSKDLIEEPSSYIIQEKVEIMVEYRVYMIFGEIMPMVALKSSKTPHKKVAIYKTEHISDSLREFTYQLGERIPFDVVGLDVAKTKEGYTLIELNRSCLFDAYFTFTGINLAEVFVNKLLQRSN